MPKAPLPDLAIILFFLRSGQGWSQAELGEAAGVSPNLLNDYERGRKILHRERLEYLISWMGLPPETIDETLKTLAANRAASRAPAAPGDRFAAARRRIDAIAARVGRLAEEFARAVLTLLTFEGEALHGRQKAEWLWTRLKKRSAEERSVLMEDSREYRDWALCERVVAESLEKAANHPREALELAQLALRIAELLPGEALWRLRLQGYALAAVSNGHRVCSDVPEAGRTLERALKLWKEGASGDPGLLNEAVVPWIAAVVRREQRRFPEARKLAEEALALDSGELRGKILISKSNILEILDDPEGSTAALTEAAPLIDAGREPRLALVLRHNLLRDLTHLKRFDEAASRLHEVRGMAERLGEELDLARVVWMEGKIWAGLGRTAEALAALEQARRAFRARELAYDYAQVSLDLALVHLETGRNREVRPIADEMVWIFRAQGVERETIAAIRVFCAAAKGEVVTIDLAQRIARFLHRAQFDPELRLELEGRGPKPVKSPGP